MYIFVYGYINIYIYMYGSIDGNKRLVIEENSFPRYMYVYIHMYKNIHVKYMYIYKYIYIYIYIYMYGSIDGNKRLVMRGKFVRKVSFWFMSFRNTYLYINDICIKLPSRVTIAHSIPEHSVLVLKTRKVLDILVYFYTYLFFGISNPIYSWFLWIFLFLYMVVEYIKWLGYER
jgi:hypothetical protein